MTATATATLPKRSGLPREDIRRLCDQAGVEETAPTAEAAQLLRVTSQTMRRWACEGSGPIRPRKVNGRLRWSIAEIRAVLAGSPVSASHL